jgi:hypothetical protein
VKDIQQEPAEPDPALPTGPAPPPVVRRRRPRSNSATAAAKKKKNTKRIAVIAGTAALTTAVSGIVGGLVSPERVQSVLGLSDDADASVVDESPSATPDESPSSEAPPALEFKRVQDSTGAIALDVPVGWATADAEFAEIDGVFSVGRGLRSGPDPTEVRFVSQETIWVGASSQAFDDLNLDDYDEFGVRALLAQRRENATYLAQAGCVPTPTGEPDLGDRWYGAARVWQDCSSIDGWRAIEIEMISAARDAYVFVQIGLAPDTPDDVAQRVVDTLTVLAPNLPVS